MAIAAAITASISAEVGVREGEYGLPGGARLEWTGMESTCFHLSNASIDVATLVVDIKRFEWEDRKQRGVDQEMVQRGLTGMEDP